ncbi:tRNA pseudouridine(55) synthase TruB [Anaerobacillus alkalidiazotrophicus]|uniref:tRNA pseudouridine synthase B n=1 Tax=Anaerobacillus alkalidiazotrophicus TaxID=472963 RepID=A0A1S2M051_9BACI|nr:tRNA pseudouridine(55) synthase TruB [Anaerobacillus alkalidiazotrophicus]OIJ17880.1 tRNA pseudouridine(55) synthase TruB [Anaerobacillus alkalidiazotrophicus]
MELQGILPLHKPKGMTSHDCVAKLRRILKTRKIGHTGTLDPEVTGVLPICIGRATKVAQYMSDYSKTYEGEVTIGFSTTTEDFTGEKLEEKVVERLFSCQEINEVLQSFTGEIEQIPPMYSAVKVKGKKLYEYAREGKTVERPVRHVNIHELTLLTEPLLIDGNKVKFSFRVHCSKGTYVRTLAVDIGKKLGYPAHMSALVRTVSGPFQLEHCLTFEEIENKFTNNELQASLLKIDDALSFLKRIVVNDATALKVMNGMVLPTPLEIDENRFTIYNKNEECLAIYIKHPTKQGLMKPEKVLKNDQV